MIHDLITYGDVLCTAVFAISGALAAVESRMDLGGALVLAFVTGVGGGTLRDLVLDREVFWLTDHTPLYAIAIAGTLAFFMSRSVRRLHPAILWMDALGLALFSSVGTVVALNHGAAPIIAVMMGACSACGGGILREVIRNELPIILQRDIYITAAVAGAATLVGLEAAGLDLTLASVAGATVAFALRASGIVLGWSLPVSKGEE